MNSLQFGSRAALAEKASYCERLDCRDPDDPLTGFGARHDAFQLCLPCQRQHRAHRSCV
jgi:hypothetical protein